MSSNQLRAKIAKGLKKAVIKTGSNNSEPVYLVGKSTTGGTPLNPGVVIKTKILLKDAIFKEYGKTLNDKNIQQGDRLLVSQYDVPIKQGDKIQQSDTIYMVVSVEEKAPTSDVLIYFSQLRVQHAA
jgi:hypothetical protein